MTKPHPQLYQLARKMRLLRLTDLISFLLDLRANRPANREFKKEHSDFKLPPTGLVFDACHYTSWQRYYDTGLAQAGYFSALFKRHLPNRHPLRICEWGCGPARIIRHFGELMPRPQYELFGTDYNDQTIRWCRGHIPGINFASNELRPPLSFDEKYFDGLLARSVFSHLSAASHTAWSAELYRVLNDNGILIVTTNGDNFKENLLAEELTLYESGALVVRGGVREGRKAFAAFHPPAYVREHLLKDFSIVEHIPAPDCLGLVQDVWIAIKKDRVILSSTLPTQDQTYRF